jgi:hypothetical protein
MIVTIWPLAVTASLVISVSLSRFVLPYNHYITPPGYKAQPRGVASPKIL